ncbi:hypothetical protein D3C80_732680 [compost metagenome]
MKRVDISAYADETTSWGEQCWVGVLSIDESPQGKWVDAIEAEAYANSRVAQAQAAMIEAHEKATAELREKLNHLNLKSAAEAEAFVRSEDYYHELIKDMFDHMDNFGPVPQHLVKRVVQVLGEEVIEE